MTEKYNEFILFIILFEFLIIFAIQLNKFINI
jgi:hypothetical protein